jgi:hypothetical protein
MSRHCTGSYNQAYLQKLPKALLEQELFCVVGNYGKILTPKEHKCQAAQNWKTLQKSLLINIKMVDFSLPSPGSLIVIGQVGFAKFLKLRKSFELLTLKQTHQ